MEYHLVAKELLLGEEDSFIRKEIVVALKKLNCDYKGYNVHISIQECLDSLNEVLPGVTGSFDVEEETQGFKITLFKYYFESDWIMANFYIKKEEISGTK